MKADSVRQNLTAWAKLGSLKPDGPVSAAHAADLPIETFTATERNSVQAHLVQGKVAKALGAKAKEVQVGRGSITFTGKALEKVRASMEELTALAGAKAGGSLNSLEGARQLSLHSYRTHEGGKGTLEYPSPIVTDPNPSASPVAQLSYLVSRGPTE